MNVFIPYGYDDFGTVYSSLELAVSGVALEEAQGSGGDYLYIGEFELNVQTPVKVYTAKGEPYLSRDINNNMVRVGE